MTTNGQQGKWRNAQEAKSPFEAETSMLNKHVPKMAGAASTGSGSEAANDSPVKGQGSGELEGTCGNRIWYHVSSRTVSDHQRAMDGMP